MHIAIDRRFFAFALIMMSGSALGAPVPSNTGKPGAICLELTSAIESDLMEMSDLYISNLTDDSAPRVTMRAAQLGARAGEIQANISLMGANHCEPYRSVISHAAYLGNALACQTARSKAVSERLRNGDLSKPSSVPTECDRSTWVRGFVADSH